MAKTSGEEGKKEAVKSSEMVVTATKIEQSPMDVPFFTSVVTRDDFEKMGAKNLIEALRSIPGLQIGVQGNAYPHIEVRGFRDTKDLAVLIDGVPFRQVNGSADLTMIPLGIVERIEFVKGPGSSIWGRGAVAGTLNIITVPEDTSRMQAKVQAGGGSWNTFQGDAKGLLPYKQGYVLFEPGDLHHGRLSGTAPTATPPTRCSTGATASAASSAWAWQGLFSKVDANRGSTGAAHKRRAGLRRATFPTTSG